MHFYENHAQLLILNLENYAKLSILSNFVVTMPGVPISQKQRWAIRTNISIPDHPTLLLLPLTTLPFLCPSETAGSPLWKAGSDHSVQGPEASY